MRSLTKKLKNNFTIKNIRPILIFLLLFLWLNNLFAQFYKVELTPEKKDIYLGDRVKFYLKISSNTKIKYSKILDNSTKYYIFKKTKNAHIYYFLKQFFKTGKVVINPIKINVNGVELYSDNVTIYVKSNLKKDSKFNDVKPPEEVGFYLTKKEKLEILIALVLLLIIIFIFLKVRKKKKKANDKDKYDFNYLLPIEEAKKNIKICEKYLEEGDLKNFYTHLSYTLRKFIQRKKKLELIELTIEEIIEKYRNIIPEEIIYTLKRWDDIRFSGIFPDYNEIKKDLEKLKEIIENVENS